MSKMVENHTLNDIETVPETVCESGMTLHCLRHPERDFLLRQTYPGLESTLYTEHKKGENVFGSEYSNLLLPSGIKEDDRRV